MKKLPWWSKYRGKPGAGVGQQSQDRADFSGGRSPVSTTLAYEYLRQSLRTNAPGYADQNYFEMSRAYVGAPYLAINSKSIQAGCAEVRLVERDLDDPEAEEPLSLHEDACQLIHEPNPDEGFGDLMEQISLQYDLTGTVLLWVPHDVEDPHDLPREMYVLSTASCLPQPISPLYPQGAYLVQPWYPAGPYATIPVSQGVGATVPAEQIIRIKAPHPFFRWIGYSTLYAISMQIDALKQADISRMNAFQKGIDPTAVLTWDPSIRKPTEADLRRLEEQLKAVYAGPVNVGRIFMAPVGSDIKTLSNVPKDMAYQEGWSQLVDFTLATLGVNKAVAGMTGDINYATLFASLRAFYLLRLDPFLNKVALAFDRHLLHPFFGRNFFMKLTSKSITDESLFEQQVNTLGKFKAIKIGELRRAYKKVGFPIPLDETDRDDEWAGPEEKQQPGQQGGMPGMPPPGAVPGDEEEEPGDPDRVAMQRERPDNPEGRGGAAGALGPRKMVSANDRHERLQAAFERAFSNGRAKPYKS